MTAHRLDLSCAVWRKSTRRSSSGQNCVEIATNLPGIVAVRDSKNPHGAFLAVSRSAWAVFVADIQNGQLGA
jgi:hypothetical protein